MLAYERLIALEGAHNVRDLGGYRTADGGLTRWRSILRGDALHALSAADIDTLLENGLTTVIDLRNAHEIDAEANPFTDHAEVRYHNTPVFSALAPVEMMANASVSFDMGDRYCQAIDNCQPAIAEVLNNIAEAPEGAVLFHCSAGKDRTGVISALLLANAGVDETTIIEDYALTATISGPLIARLRDRALGRGTPAALVDIVLASEPRSMRQALDHIGRNYGTVRDYLVRLGFDEPAMARLRGRLS
ncbi:tyrosine-protein phosphatase [Neorhizobium galegae]|uniref:tyrosine-protein phosphatase n=1 Tax=Neorhizobium galegae TaxID=399 RepID=UPI0006211D69|nr:tyrosine-protein phosphatase [Neorhizobium galegae]MCQ1779020.1 tyrosine-protein phosphatase [Neorhizobium galegae]MCQ1795472.1 tyrosine-protein phosphatase [Neorhizobium galegae]CDZ25509.1 Protein tyrosine/serine phosphatase [Neorhizobium galegae bv. officinalis]